MERHWLPLPKSQISDSCFHHRNTVALFKVNESNVGNQLCNTSAFSISGSPVVDQGTSKHFRVWSCYVCRLYLWTTEKRTTLLTSCSLEDTHIISWVCLNCTIIWNNMYICNEFIKSCLSLSWSHKQCWGMSLLKVILIIVLVWKQYYVTHYKTNKC